MALVRRLVQEHKLEQVLHMGKQGHTQGDKHELGERDSSQRQPNP